MKYCWSSTKLSFEHSLVRARSAPSKAWRVDESSPNLTNVWARSCSLFEIVLPFPSSSTSLPGGRHLGTAPVGSNNDNHSLRAKSANLSSNFFLLIKPPRAHLNKNNLGNNMNNFHPRSCLTASPRTLISSKAMRSALRNGPLMHSWCVLHDHCTSGEFVHHIHVIQRPERFPNNCWCNSWGNNIFNFHLINLLNRSRDHGPKLL